MNNFAEVMHENKFYERFIKDLQKANSLVVILSPYLGIRRIEEISSALKRCVQRGVVVCVFARSVKGNIENAQIAQNFYQLEQARTRLQDLGVHVTLLDNMHAKVVLIDSHIIYHGSQNVLSHYDSRERMTREVSPELVVQALLMHGLDSCQICCSAYSKKSIYTIDPAENRRIIGLLLRNGRHSKNLSLRELAASSQIHHGQISRLEKGQNGVHLNTLLSVCMPLGYGCRIIPWALLPKVDNMLSNYHSTS